MIRFRPWKKNILDYNAWGKIYEEKSEENEAVHGPILGLNIVVDVAPFLNLIEYINFGLSLTTYVLCDNLFETVLAANKLLPKGSVTADSSLTLIDLQLNSTSSGLQTPFHPTISITTQEESPRHWNLVGDGTKTNTVGFMEEATITFKNAESITRAVAGALPPQLKGKKAKLNKAADEFQDAWQWINVSEAGWMTVIGAGQGVTKIEHTIQVGFADAQACEKKEDCPTGYDCIEGYCIKDGVHPCDETGGVPTTYTYYEYIPNDPLPNDGVVLVSSQHVPGEIFNRHLYELSHWNQHDAEEVHEEIKNLMSAPIQGFDVFFFPNCTF